METNVTKKGFWMMVEEPVDETNETKSAQDHASQNVEKETFRDTYDFYPDFGF